VLRGANTPTRCPAANTVSTPRSASGTAPAASRPRYRRRGDPTAPGPPSTCAGCTSRAGRDRPAAEPGPAWTRSVTVPWIA